MTKDDFTEKLKNIGLTKKEFSEMTNLAYMTVNNWNDKTKPIPGWVDSWLQNYIKSTKFDKAKKIFDDEFAE